MNRSTVIAFVATAAFGLSATAFADDKMDHAAVKAEKERIEAEYKADKARCDELSGNGKDVCIAQAKAKERIAKADLEATAKGTAKSRYEAQVTRAEAEYDVAKEKCDDLAGNQKDVCEKEAKAIEQRAKAEAKAAYKS
ncbi:MAG TPA: hypothetical protein VMM15_41195 [Bradyrhizobium sp.]|nr:hypothetical protein [Bradyrhizobium sp.]